MKMCSKIPLFAIVFFLISFIPCIASDISENDLIASSEKVIGKWKNMLSNGYVGARMDRGSGGSWKAMILQWVDDSASFDIKKTDSIVSPYILIIKFKEKLCGTNYFSPNANGTFSNFFKRIGGFKTIEEAFLNVNETDFLKEDKAGNYVPNNGHVFDRVLTYALQNGSWVLDMDSEEAKIRFEMWTPNKETEFYTKQLLSIPVK